jgi:hypothetical protein
MAKAAEHPFRAAVTVLGALAAIAFGLLTFGSSIVARAEASVSRVEDRIEGRLTRIEQKLDDLLRRVAP